MQDSGLADELISRLNALLEDPSVRHDLGVLLNQEVACTKTTADHPTIQVRTTKIPGLYKLSPLGLLNGLVGTLPSGAKEGWGYITAVYNDAGELVSFERTDKIGFRG